MGIEGADGDRKKEFRGAADLGRDLDGPGRIAVRQAFGEFEDTELPAEADILFNVFEMDLFRPFRDRVYND